MFEACKNPPKSNYEFNLNEIFKIFKYIYPTEKCCLQINYRYCNILFGDLWKFNFKNRAIDFNIFSSNQPNKIPLNTIYQDIQLAFSYI